MMSYLCIRIGSDVDRKKSFRYTLMIVHKLCIELNMFSSFCATGELAVPCTCNPL